LAQRRELGKYEPHPVAALAVTSTMTACPTATTASRKTGIVGEPEAMSSL
jgi:hypothetical protein